MLQKVISPSNRTPGRVQLEQSRAETLRYLLLLFMGAGFALLACSSNLDKPVSAIGIGLVIHALTILSFIASIRHFGIAVGIFMICCLVSPLLMASWVNQDAIYLLIFPAAIAVAFVGLPAGVIMAALCTVLLYRGPIAFEISPSSATFISIGIWGTVWIVWLALRPLVGTLEWSWASYQEKREFLERARDYQMRLKQTLEDLADANLQFARLNQIADGLRRSAEKARQAKEAFARNVSHELRTPLNMILGFSDMILEMPDIYGCKLPSALLSDLDVIRRNSKHLSGLVDDILDLSQLEAGEMALCKEYVSPLEEIKLAMTTVRPLFQSKDLYLKIDAPENLRPVFCDRQRIRQVILNILSNAGRFTQRGGVLISVREEADDLVVSIADTGPGIAAKDMDKLFQPFHQLYSFVRNEYGGSGLGLSISKHFIELHGGKIWIESKEGAGTTVFFRLPIDIPHTEAPVTRWLDPDWPSRQRLRDANLPVKPMRPRLVVLESGSALARLITRHMRDVEVVSVHDLAEAYDELAATPAQALLVNDLSISNALQDIEALGNLPYDTPVIVCPIPGVSEVIHELGVSDYLIKPVSPKLLLTALAKLELSGRDVLIVDDDMETLHLWRRILAASDRNYRVFRATDGQQALHLLDQHHPDVVLLDLMMPNMDGYRFLECKARNPACRDIPVIVISAHDPMGQPVISNALAVTRSRGLSTTQLLTMIEAISRILSPVEQHAVPAAR